MSKSWLFLATCDEQGEDKTASGAWRSHLQKWRALRFIQPLVIFVAFTSLCLYATSGEQNRDEACEV